MRKTLTAALITIVSFGASAAERTPVDVVTDIYRIAAGPKGDYQSPGMEEPRIHAMLSRSLQTALAAMERRSRKLNEPILDFDPITASQDPTVRDLRIAAGPGGDATHPIVDASFDSGAPQRTLVRYVFARDGAAWKVDDIRSDAGDDKWDLREIITPK